MRILLILLCAAAPARAQIDDEPTPVAPTAPAPTLTPAIPDASYRAVKERNVILRMRNGGEIEGRVLGFDATTVSVALSPSQTVTTFERAEIVALRVELAPQVAPIIVHSDEEAAAVQSGLHLPPRERHFALQLGLAPGLDIDLDYKLLYAFANVSLVLPMASDGGLNGMSTGIGLNFRVSKDSGWKFEVFASVSAASLSSSEWIGGVGVGIGIHYTFVSGFTLGFKAPILGYGFGHDANQGGTAVAFYYLSSAMGMPLMSVGYRF